MYDTPQTMTHLVAAAVSETDFGGASNVALTFVGPPGARGLIREVYVQVAEVVAADTTEPVLEVGTTAGNAEVVALTIPDGTAVGSEVWADADDYVDRRIDADETIHVTANIGVDGTGVTGQARIYLVIDWDVEQPRPYASG